MAALGSSLSSRARGERLAGRITTALLVVIVVVNALYLLRLFGSGGEADPIVDLGLWLATQGAPVAILWLAVVRTRFTRVPVILAAAGVTLSASGDTYYSLAMGSDGYLPSPSLADLGYLLFYPLMTAALVTLVRKRLRGLGRLVLLETAVATVGAAAVLATILDPVIRRSLDGDDPLAGAVAIAYPLFDLVMLAVIAGVASAPTMRLGRRSWALVAGLVVTAFADIAYALLDNFGAYMAGTPLDAAWTGGLALMAWWGAGMAEPGAEPRRSRPRQSTIPVPAVAVLTGLAMLVVATQAEVSLLAVVLAALTVGLGAVPIVFRQAILGRMLADQDEAVRRLSALDKAKTDIMVTMNHEFRTPLTSITGHVDLLLDGGAGELPTAAIRMLETIERNGERLQALIDDTLTSSRLQDQADLLVCESVDLGELVGGAVARVSPLATKKGVELTQEPDVDGLLVDADRVHLEQGVVNVLDNAVKFTPAGGRVTVTTERVARDRAAIRVSDEGIGVPEADIPSLFTRFFRASNVQNAAIPGVGLGLSITEQVVLAHNGSLDVDSVLGQGTTVTMRLPLRRR